MLSILTMGFLAAPNPYLERVLVVMNGNSQTSVEIGADYLKQRGLKEKLIVKCADSSESAANETIPYTEFKPAIEDPLRAYLSKHPKIDFIVLTKGVPIRITGAPLGLNNDRPSMDSFIAALDYDKSPASVKIVLNEGFKGTCYANRFWSSTERFSHAKFGGYLVTRLDGYTLGDAKLLVRYAIQGEKQKPAGSILLDSKAAYTTDQLKSQPVPIFMPSSDPSSKVRALADVRYDHYDMDLCKAAEVLKPRNLPVTLDTAPDFVTGSDLMGYCSWGSNDPKFKAENYKKLRFAPGGIAETAVSTSARTFLPTTGGQSLIADLIQGRVTGVKGYCDEPLLTAVASPTILFDRYTRGWTLAESFYAASRWTGWEDIVIGDPICTPYGR